MKICFDASAAAPVRFPVRFQEAAIPLFGVLFVVVNLIVDILYGVLDPRARAAGGKR